VPANKKQSAMCTAAFQSGQVQPFGSRATLLGSNQLINGGAIRKKKQDSRIAEFFTFPRKTKQ